MKIKPIRVLLIEDNPTVASFLEDFLSDISSPTFVVAHVETLSAAVDILTAKSFDVVLLDLGLPGSQGVDTFTSIYSRTPTTVPIIVLTGSDNEELALEIVRKGAQDYLVKGHVDTHLLVRAIRYAIERKLVGEKLRKSEAQNRALLEAIPDLILRLKSDGVCLYFKPVKTELLENNGNHFFGKKITEVLPLSLAEAILDFLLKVIESGQTQVIEHQLWEDGRPRDYEARIVCSGDGEALVIVREITERKNMEKQILEVIGQEQRRIGQDLHDGLGQHLTGVAFMSQVLGQRLAAKSVPEAADAARIAELVNQGIGQTRDLARGLVPVELESNGLIAALKELIAHVQNFSTLSCDFQCNAEVLIDDHVMATHLYRIAQEALNNAIKHSQAKNIWVKLIVDKQKGFLTVTDNGIGINGNGGSKGLGMCIMKYRTRMIGASLFIRQQPSGGTVVSCVFPYQVTAKN